ncbi:AAA family ATPase [Xanthobacter sp. YC-JY1]|uniref:AAA family ATPase n=1 Tax=Xanthobacter sp. YC-JY1 TaxID=2419844 RepID=UPI001F4210A7|nr:AAA family ATPase [Xanthobacter sp. YC-JY1]UJX46291.1 cobyrinic acid a,c-diamide synthase [Xanthobacter sp. YC-JY1]
MRSPSPRPSVRCSLSTAATSFIQGPPGAGKTYTSSQAIVALLAEGKRVAVASNGHKAIDQLLREVEALARDTSHREAPELARDTDMILIDGPPRVAGLMRSALLAADLVLLPVQPSPLDGWASAEMLALLNEARIYRPELAARFVLNRCGARTVLARETAEMLADHDPPVIVSTIGQRVSFATSAQSGRLVGELDEGGRAAREIAALAAEIVGLGVPGTAR